MEMNLDIHSEVFRWGCAFSILIVGFATLVGVLLKTNIEEEPKNKQDRFQDPFDNK